MACARGSPGREGRPLVLDAGSPKAIACAAEVVRKGGVVAFPTETVYGLAARTGDRAARARLARAKGREEKKPFQVLVSDRRAALRMCGRLPACARKLARAFWPGPLTLVVKGRNGRWLGLRVPDHPVATALLRRCGGSLVATSANRSGEQDAFTAAEVISALGDRVDVVLDGGAAQRRKPSTVVRCDGENWSILREGAIRRATILRLLARNLAKSNLAKVRTNLRKVSFDEGADG
jgi:L-threonylcarbamoyladenylate synthase